MKALHIMTNVEKAQLLAALFPEELPEVLQSIKKRYVYLQAHKQQIRQTWDHGLLPFDFWYQLAENVHGAIEKYNKKLLKSRKLFADQLFDGYNALFTVDCLVRYAGQGKNTSPFKLVILVFFDPPLKKNL